MSDNENSAAVDNEELTAFVASTLKAIAAGIEEASATSLKQASNGYNTFEMPNKVSFDVAVSAKRSHESGKGLKVEVFSVGAGIKGAKASHSETISRITFEVPWQYTRTAPITSPPRGGWQA